MENFIFVCRKTEAFAWVPGHFQSLKRLQNLTADALRGIAMELVSVREQYGCVFERRLGKVGVVGGGQEG